MTTRRNGIIRAFAAMMAILGGRHVIAEQTGTDNTKAVQPAFDSVYQFPAAASSSIIFSPRPQPKSIFTLYLDDSAGFDVRLGVETIHLTPEEIMTALREG